jgi:hypothetical protein
VYGTTTFAPVADSYVDASAPTTNHGTALSLRVDGSPVVRSFLRFSVGGLGGTVSSASLRIFPTSSQKTGRGRHLGRDDDQQLQRAAVRWAARQLGSGDGEFVDERGCHFGDNGQRPCQLRTVDVERDCAVAVLQGGSPAASAGHNHRSSGEFYARCDACPDRHADGRPDRHAHDRPDCDACPDRHADGSPD